MNISGNISRSFIQHQIRSVPRVVTNIQAKTFTVAQKQFIQKEEATVALRLQKFRAINSTSFEQTPSSLTAFKKFNSLNINTSATNRVLTIITENEGIQKDNSLTESLEEVQHSNLQEFPHLLSEIDTLYHLFQKQTQIQSKLLSSHPQNKSELVLYQKKNEVILLESTKVLETEISSIETADGNNKNPMLKRMVAAAILFLVADQISNKESIENEHLDPYKQKALDIVELSCQERIDHLEDLAQKLESKKRALRFDVENLLDSDIKSKVLVDLLSVEKEIDQSLSLLSTHTDLIKGLKQEIHNLDPSSIDNSSDAKKMRFTLAVLQAGLIVNPLASFAATAITEILLDKSLSLADIENNFEQFINDLTNSTIEEQSTIDPQSTTMHAVKTAAVEAGIDRLDHITQSKKLLPKIINGSIAKAPTLAIVKTVLGVKANEALSIYPEREKLESIFAETLAPKISSGTAIIESHLDNIVKNASENPNNLIKKIDKLSVTLSVIKNKQLNPSLLENIGKIFKTNFNSIFSS